MKGQAVICMLPGIREDFLPPDLFGALKELLPDLLELPPTSAWGGDTEFFAREEPEILITGWGAPRLPASRAAMPSVQYVCHLPGSVRGLVPRSLLEEGLLVTNWGSCHAGTVAECALMLILCTLRRTAESNLVMHVDKGWKWPNDLRPQSLFHRRVGLHGFGAVARSLLPLLKPFGVSVQAYSAGVPAEIFAASGVRQAASLEELFSTSDVLVEVEAASSFNIGSVTENHFRLLPPGAVFVNVGRAAVVEEAALMRVAGEGWLPMGLDVYHQEPLPADSPLRGLPHVCLLGHQAGPTPDRRCDCGRFALENLRAYRAGQPLRGVVTAEAFDLMT